MRRERSMRAAQARDAQGAWMYPEVVRMRGYVMEEREICRVDAGQIEREIERERQREREGSCGELTLVYRVRRSGSSVSPKKDYRRRHQNDPQQQQ
jgi:hypothetical protein